jgi:hypothetical protein
MKKILKNIKTTLFGAIAGLPQVLEGIAEKDLTKIVVGIGTLAVGLFAKDDETLGLKAE